MHTVHLEMMTRPCSQYRLRIHLLQGSHIVVKMQNLPRSDYPRSFVHKHASLTAKDIWRRKNSVKYPQIDRKLCKSVFRCSTLVLCSVLHTGKIENYSDKHVCCSRHPPSKTECSYFCCQLKFFSLEIKYRNYMYMYHNFHQQNISYSIIKSLKYNRTQVGYWNTASTSWIDTTQER